MTADTRRYVVLEREDTWLAVLDNSHNDTSFLDVYVEQGFRPYDYAFRHFYSPITAKSAHEAVEIAKEDKTLEINALREEIFRLKEELRHMQRRDRVQFTPDMLNPYEVLGVSPTTDFHSIKEKRREYLKFFHTDHGGGSKLLFQLINHAFQRIEARHR